MNAIKAAALWAATVAALACMAAPARAQQEDPAMADAHTKALANVEIKTVPIRHWNFDKVDKDAQGWNGICIGSNGKIYIGLCTHADSAGLFEFDIATEKMRKLANLSVLAGERGKGIWTNGKIHVDPVELDGYVYFGSFCEDNGPPAIDAASFQGAYWWRIDMATGKVEHLSKITESFWGLASQTIDREHKLIYGVADNGHLLQYHIEGDYTSDLGRVDAWDVARGLFVDDLGNVYGPYPAARIWKYDYAKDRVFDLPYIRLPVDGQARSMFNPTLDRKSIWRTIEWDAQDKVAYGITGGGNLLFKYNPHDGPQGKITALAQMCAPVYRGGKEFNIPFATLGFTLNMPMRKVYAMPIIGGDFDYNAIKMSGDARETAAAKNPPLSFLVAYDLATDKIEDLGIMRTKEGVRAMGLACAESDKDGRVWFVGAFDEPNPDYEIEKMSKLFPYSMGLAVYDPREAQKQSAQATTNSNGAAR